MACTSCSQTTCNCTPTSICETCIDVTSSECIYYKGSLTNNLGLSANFRFNTFAEKVVQVLGGIDSILDTYPISVALTRKTDAINSYATTITLNRQVSIGGSLTDEIKTTTDFRPNFAYANLTTGGISISDAGTLVPLESSTNVYNHSVVHASDYIATATSRTSRQRITLDLGYSITPDVAVYIKVVVYEKKMFATPAETAIKTYWITASAAATSDVISFSFINIGPESESQVIKEKRYSVKMFCYSNKGTTSSTQTLTIDSGSFSVEETGY
jgi:hypothetical protein